MLPLLNFFKWNLLLTALYIGAVLFWYFPVKFIEGLEVALFGIIFILLYVLWDFDVRRYSRQKSIQIKGNEEEKDALFLDDQELFDPDADELGFRDDAIRFATDVLNDGSDNPIVFGLDAPWGSGKSSYLNLCKKLVWEKEKGSIVFEFKPVLYDTKKQDILAIFIGELVKKLKNERIYTHSLESDFKAYLRSIKSFHFLGLDIDLSGVSRKTSEDALADIKEDISRIDKKVIIIVDDLDRLYLEDIKSILGIVRNVFYFPHVAFVLCYDTCNINTFDARHEIIHTYSVRKGANQYSRSEHELNNQKINAYFEKIVQVKKTLIPNRDKLQTYFKNGIRKINGNVEDENIARLLSGVEYFFQPERYPSYQPLLGDLRKIKRILNFLRASDLVVKFDYTERDIDPKSLMQLVLLYINFPHIFRKVYNAETDGSFGFFSVERNEDAKNDELKFKNSDRFLDYINTLLEDERFLLRELFYIDIKTDRYEQHQMIERMKDIEFERTSPMFNGGLFFRKNLEDYLQIIVDRKLLPRWRYDSFHLNRIEELRSRSVEDIFEHTPEYHADNGEAPRDQFFMNARSTSIDFDRAHKIIDYIIGNIHRYSLVNEFSEIYNGLRDDLIYEVVFILNRKGWRDKNGETYENSPENVLLIANRIFGDGQFVGKGVIDSLITKERGIIGLVDASRFSSACSRRDSSDLWNVYTAIETYEKDKGISVGRVLSQRIFSAFVEMVIKKKLNIFNEISNFTEHDLFGDFSAPIRKAFKSKDASVDDEIKRIKTSFAGYFIYQFGGREPGSCGAHDVSGDVDNGGISQEMRKYLFDVCFNIDLEKENAKYFVDHMLANFSWVHGIRGTKYAPLLSDFVKSLGGELLKEYWIRNGDFIKKYSKGFPQDTKIITYNYWLTYASDLDILFKELDKLALEDQQEVKKVS